MLDLNLPPQEPCRPSPVQSAATPAAGTAARTFTSRRVCCTCCSCKEGRAPGCRQRVFKSATGKRRGSGLPRVAPCPPPRACFMNAAAAVPAVASDCHFASYMRATIQVAIGPSIASALAIVGGALHRETRNWNHPGWELEQSMPAMATRRQDIRGGVKRKCRALVGQASASGLG